MDPLTIALFIVLIYLLFFYVANLSRKYEYFTIDEEGFTGTPAVQPKCRVAIASQMRKPIDLPLWLKHHRNLGVKQFYIRLEDTPGWEEYLQAQKDVVYELGESDKKGSNYDTVQGRQIAWTNKSITSAKQLSIDWIINIDADELLHGSLAILDTVPPNKKCIKLENAEAVFEEGQDTCFSSKKFLRCSNGAPCRAYANGKGGGRIEEGVQQAGCHDFNYNGTIDDITTEKISFKELCVLHFDSCTFGSWAEKFKHLGNNSQKSDIPFPYYKKSIEVAKNAYKVYKESTMQDIANLESDKIFRLG
jgi:hypothetical protein